MASQLAATWAAMTSNFFLNNVFTYGDSGCAAGGSGVA